MLFTIIVPARYNSSRLPGKALKLIDGRPMVQWVYETCKLIEEVNDVIIATDHELIFKTSQDFGANVQMTSSDHLSGTDRCAEIAKDLKSDYIINVQGDEPFINPNDLKSMIHYLRENSNIEILTLYHELEVDQIDLPSNVKLVKDKNDKVLYFSRSPIPFPRKEHSEPYYKHVGIYAFSRATLLKLSMLEPSTLELTEGLEQLRWLQHGYEIFGIKVDKGSLSIDTEADLVEAIRYAEGLPKN